MKGVLSVSILAVVTATLGFASIATMTPVDAKPDQTKFCAEFNNDDGTIGESCEYKSKGECKKGSIAAGDDFRGCTKNDGEEPDGGNNLSPDEDGEGGGSGPND